MRSFDDENAKELLEKVKNTYNAVATREPWKNPIVEELYEKWLGGHDSETVKKLLHTKYHEVEKLQTTLTKW